MIARKLCKTKKPVDLNYSFMHLIIKGILMKCAVTLRQINASYGHAHANRDNTWSYQQVQCHVNSAQRENDYSSRKNYPLDSSIILETCSVLETCMLIGVTTAPKCT